MRMIALAVTALLVGLALAGCDLPQLRLVCTRGGHEVYRSAWVNQAYQRDKADSWVVGNSYYMPEPGSTCRLEFDR